LPVSRACQFWMSHRRAIEASLARRPRQANATSRQHRTTKPGAAAEGHTLQIDWTRSSIWARTLFGHDDPGTYGLLFGLPTRFASRIVGALGEIKGREIKRQDYSFRSINYSDPFSPAFPPALTRSASEGSVMQHALSLAPSLALRVSVGGAVSTAIPGQPCCSCGRRIQIARP